MGNIYFKGGKHLTFTTVYDILVYGFSYNLFDVDHENFGKFREQCRNVFLRHIYLDLYQKISLQLKK